MGYLHPTLSFLTLFQLFASILAAGPITVPSSTTTPNITRLQDDPPPAPFQMRVYGTSTQLVFYGYSPLKSIGESAWLHAAFSAQQDIIKAVVPAPAGPQIIHTPNLLWRYGSLFISMNSRNFEMTWKILADALRGILDFYNNYNTIALKVDVLDDQQGWVGSMEVGIGYNALGNGTAAATA